MRRFAPAGLLAAILVENCAMPHAKVDPSVDPHPDAAAGSGGTGGKSDAAPAPKGFLSLEEAARLCSFSFSCPNLPPSIRSSLRLDLDVSSYSNCVDELAGPLPPNRPGIVQQTSVLECAAKAANCTAAAACMAVEVIDANDPRCQVTDGGDGCSVDGRSVIKCTEGNVLHCDNAFYHPGSMCLPTSTGDYWCAVAGTCNTNVVCIDTFASICGAGQTESFDCAMTGWDCGLDVNGEVHCLVDGKNPLCSSASIECNADHVRYCDGTAYSDIDCTALGAACVSAPFPHCERSADACKQTDATQNQCSGDSISLCVGGQPQSFDCTSLNMKCVAGVGPESAHCE